MTDLAELELNKPTVDPDDGRGRSRVLRAVIVMGVLAAALGMGYFALRRSAPQGPAQTAVKPTVAPSPPAPTLRSEPGEDIVLPPLDQTDSLVRQLVRQLSSHPRLLAWLGTNGLIQNFTVVTVNIATGETPAPHLRRLAPASPFRAIGTAGTLHLDPRSYQRYDTYADAVGGLDARGAARLYATLKPRITEASRELGNPQGDFDPVLERAIVELLRVPIVDGDVALTAKIISYRFADPRLEALSAAQRQFLRMGPRNVRIVQSKLREIAPFLGIPNSRLPQPVERSG
jgi:Protein of unknown function (DUF3014)